MARGIIAIGIENEDELVAARVTDGSQIVFLATHLGMAIRFDESDVRSMGRPAFGVRGRFMEGHGTRVELFERSESLPGIGGQDPPAALLTRGYGHIAFATSDLDTTFAELVARGATPVWDPRPSPEPGVRMAFVADLDGNLIEMIEPASGKTA